MERIQLKELNANYSAYDGKCVTVAGWAKTIRDSKAFGFIELNDGSCFKSTQIVFERAKIDNYDGFQNQMTMLLRYLRERYTVRASRWAK